MSRALTQQHKVVNRYLLTRGCVSKQELEDEYKAISETYPGRIRVGNGKTVIEQIIHDINRFMSFMNASIVLYDYELTDTRYYAYQLAIDCTVDNTDDLVTKHSINLPLNQLKLFHKILDLALMNKGLITKNAIYALNDKLSEESSKNCNNTNTNSKNKNIINDETLHELITFVCKKHYLYKLKAEDVDGKEGKEDASDHDVNYCIGPRSCVGLQTYIENKVQTCEDLRECPICLTTILGYGFKCPYDNCQSGIYHSKCIVEISKSDKKCVACQKQWQFDPTTRIGLLSDPKLSLDIIHSVFQNNNNNHNQNQNNESDADNDDDSNSEQSANRLSRNSRKRSRSGNQSQIAPTTKRRRLVINDDSDEETE